MAATTFHSVIIVFWKETAFIIIIIIIVMEDMASSPNHRFIYSLLDAVPPIHAESSHVATDKVPSM